MPATFDSFAWFLDSGAWTSRHIFPLFLAFKNENVAPALALVIFGAAIALCLWFLLHSGYIRIEVRRRANAVRATKDRREFAKKPVSPAFMGEVSRDADRTAP
jgi:hypothetical protein